MATFTYLPDWGASPELPQTTRKVAFGDGYEQRSQSGLMPYLPVWSLRFSRRTQAEATAIAAWLEAQQANVTPFDWAPPGSDTTASAEQFGTGDGVTPAFQLTKGGLAVTAGIVVSAITREDWQGVVALSSSARTNYLKYSEAFTDVSYTVLSITRSGGVTDPKGGATACTITATAGNGLIRHNSTVTSGTFCDSVWIKRRTGSGTISLLQPDFGGWVPVAVTGSWQRFSVSTASQGTTANWGILIGTSGDAIDIAFGQMEPGSSPWSYIPVPAASPVTITDYTLNATGLVTLGETPVSAAKLRWSGTYTLPYVKWVADKWSPATPDGFNSWSVTATFRRVMG